MRMRRSPDLRRRFCVTSHSRCRPRSSPTSSASPGPRPRSEPRAFTNGSACTAGTNRSAAPAHSGCSAGKRPHQTLRPKALRESRRVCVISSKVARWRIDIQLGDVFHSANPVDSGARSDPIDVAEPINIEAILAAPIRRLRVRYSPSLISGRDRPASIRKNHLVVQWPF